MVVVVHLPKSSQTMGENNYRALSTALEWSIQVGWDLKGPCNRELLRIIIKLYKILQMAFLQQCHKQHKYIYIFRLPFVCISSCNLDKDNTLQHPTGAHTMAIIILN